MIPIIIMFWMLCAGFSAYIASQKNRDAGVWFFIGLAFGVFALIGIAAVPSLPEKPAESKSTFRDGLHW
jgi:hypothetical protein